MSTAAVSRWVWRPEKYNQPAGVYKIDGAMSAKRVRVEPTGLLGWRTMLPLDEWLRLPLSPSEAFAAAISEMEKSIKFHQCQIETHKRTIQIVMDGANAYLFSDKQN